MFMSVLIYYKLSLLYGVLFIYTLEFHFLVDQLHIKTSICLKFIIVCVLYVYLSIYLSPYICICMFHIYGRDKYAHIHNHITHVYSMCYTYEYLHMEETSTHIHSTYIGYIFVGVRKMYVWRS